MEFLANIKLYAKANIRTFYVENYDWEKFQATILKNESSYQKLFYNDAQGLYEIREGQLIDKGVSDIIEVLLNLENNTIYSFDNIHSYFNDPQVITAFRVAFRKLKYLKSIIIVFSPVLNIPKELAKELTIIEFPLPKISEIGRFISRYAQEAKIPHDDVDEIAKTMLGLNYYEVESSIKKTIFQHQRLTFDVVPTLISEKEQIIKKSGYLEYFHPEESMNSIGGLDNLKAWLKNRSKAFHKDASEFGLLFPKGVMLLGVSGTGKSLSAKAVSHSWKMPLLRLDFGKVFGSLVGESENNIRETIKIAESIAPSILWIDEIEKGLSNGNGNDGGTSTRVFGTFLTWMQEKKSEVFVLATANDISNLPPELLRKGRFDEVFFVDLPTFEERKEILKIHILDKKQSLKNIDIDKIAKETVGFSGAELSEIVNDSLFNVYEIGKKPIVRTDDILKSAKNLFPLSRTMEEKITALRKWAKNRTKPASKYKPEDLPKFSGVRLKSEVYQNDFLDFD